MKGERTRLHRFFLNGLLTSLFSLPLFFASCKTAKKEGVVEQKFINFESSFEPAEDFIQDESGLEFAKNQVLVSILSDSQESLDQKLENIRNIVTARGWRIGGKFLLSGQKPGAILQIIGDFDSPERVFGAINELRSLDGDIKAIPNMKVEPFFINGAEVPPDPLFDTWEQTPAGNNWYFEYMNFPLAWKIHNRSDIKVGVIEFGFGLHEDLPPVVEYESLGGAEDLVEHGISVVGVLGALGANGKGIAGAVWRWSGNSGIVVRVSQTTLSSLVEDILYLVDKVKVILFAGGLRWNGSPSEQIIAYHREVFSLVFQYVRYYDVLFVQSAGNESIDGRYAGVAASVKDIFPENIIIVGSTGNGYISGFSNFGPIVDVYAPGESIFTLCLNNTYCLKTGTSYAASLIAGLATLIRSMRPDLRAPDVKNAIVRVVRDKQTSGNISERFFDNRFVADAYLSLRLAQETEAKSSVSVETSLPYIPQVEDSKGGFLAPKSLVCAVFDNTTSDGDPAFNVPKCPANEDSCSSCGLLNGRDNATGLVEPNQPNVISTSPCANADVGGTDSGRIESIQVEAMSESGFFEANRPIQQVVKLTVQAYCSAANHTIDILYTTDATATTVSWTYFGSAGCNQNPGTATFYCNTVGGGGGWKTCVAFVTLPANLPANRAIAIRARYQSTNAANNTACFNTPAVRDHDDFVFKIQATPASFQCATYNSALLAPICSDSTKGWCGTCGIARCRNTTVTSGENLAGYQNCGAGTPANPSEPNTPNTIYNGCADTPEDDSGLKDEEIRRVSIKSLATSGNFEGGQLIEISALAFCYPAADQIIFHYASGVTTSSPNVNWKHVGTIFCPTSGSSNREPFIFTSTQQLDNAEGWHAIRSIIIYAPGASAQNGICPAYTYRDADDTIFYVKAVPPSSLPVCAGFDNTTADGDPAYNTPKCPGGASQCSTCDLVRSRDNISTPETNQPNTLSTTTSCADSTAAGTYLQTESVERVEIKSFAGTFSPGATAEIRVLVNCNTIYPNYFNDRLRVLYTSNANNPTTWSVVENNLSICSGPGYVLYTKIITLSNVVGNHAIRVMFQGSDFASGQVCATGTNGDTDDLVFVVGVPQAPINFDVHGVAPDTLTLSWIDVSGETYYELRWTDTYNTNYSSWYPHPASPLAANSTFYIDKPLPEGTYRCYALRACNASGCSSYVWDCATVPSDNTNCATYNPSWQVPACGGGVSNCQTCELVVSRDSIPGRNETNTPNTWLNSCVDQGGGTYFGTGNSIERIIVSSPVSFQSGYPISVTARVYCATAGTQIRAYVSAGTSTINFTQIGTTQTCSGSGAVENKTFSFTPSTNDWYVIRIAMGGTGTCSTDSQFEADDIAIRVGGVPPIPTGFDVYFVNPNIARVVWNDVVGETYYSLISAPTSSGPFTVVASCTTGTPGQKCGQNSTLYDHAPLGAGQTICFRLAACNGIGCSSYTAVKCTARPPNPPFNLRVTAVTEGISPTVFTVTFVDNSTNEDGFVIDRIKAGDSSWTREYWYSDATTKSQTGVQRTRTYTLLPETQYCFRVASFIDIPGAGTTSLSEWADGVSRCIVAPAVPQNFEVSFEEFGSSAAAILTWQDNSANETGYVIRKGTSQLAVVGSNTVSYTDGAVSEGTTYTYSVSSYYQAVGVFAYGKTPDISVYGILRPTPLYVEQETSVVKLSWVDRSAVENGYTIERFSGGVWTQIATTVANTSFHIDSSTAINTNYCYRVRAYRTTPSANSAYSEVKCISTFGNGMQISSLTLGSTGAISVISASGVSGRLYVGTTTGYIYAVNITNYQIAGVYNASTAINGLCIKEYGRVVTVIAVTSGGSVLRLDSNLNLQNTYNAGSNVLGCAVSDSVYITAGVSVIRLNISNLSLIGSAAEESNITSGPILAGGKVYYILGTGANRSICWRNLNLSGGGCSAPFSISTSLSADDDGIYAGTSNGQIIFVTHSGMNYSKNLTSILENISGVISVYNRGGQKFLGVSTQGGRFYAVEVTRVPPVDTTFEIGVLWWRNLGGSAASPSLIQSDRVSVGNSSGHIYTLDLTDGIQIFSNTTGTSSVGTSPLSIDGLLVYGEGRNLRILAGGGAVPEVAWSRVGGNIYSNNEYSGDVILGLKEDFRICFADTVTYIAPTPVSFAGSVYYGFSATNFTDWVFRANPSGSVLSSVSYTDSMSWITSNLSVGDVLGSNPGNELVF
ncbi:MAG: S8 family serine peptidase, partial [bacterium]|nr:S8 family serine peptidase [bacterium]